MADIIQLLPDSVANQIAAGEVIQRPAAVVKELVENAVDAGSSQIKVLIKDAGKTLIQVIDNGCGMTETDARLSFERHATSKIQNADDLFAICTKGFRGEALASMAAIADIDLKTKLRTSELGSHLHIRGSEFLSQEPGNFPDGSNFSIKNLFFNVPARRKFLKSDRVEFRHICEEFKRIALPHPDIAFILVHNGVEIYNLPQSNFKQRIINTYGKKLNQSLININSDTSIAKIWGFVEKPEFAKKKAGNQYFFVNNRFMKHHYFHKAISLAFDQLIPPGTYPGYFIFFEVNPSTIDINIHPTKTEINFEEPEAIFQFLRASIRESLGKLHIAPSLNFDEDIDLDIPVYNKNKEVAKPTIDVDAGFNPFEQNTGGGNGFSSYTKTENPKNWDKLYSGFENNRESQAYNFENAQENLETAQSIPSKMNQTPAPNNQEMGIGAPGIIQFKNKYIITPVKSGLMVIDQKRAHERVLFDKYSKASGNLGNTQKCLFPKKINLDFDEAEILQEMLPQLKEIGFDLSDLGNMAFEIHGIPTEMMEHDPGMLLEELIENYKNYKIDIKTEFLEKIYIALAKTTSIKYGKQMQNEEMRDLIDKLFATGAPNMTPEGKIIISIIQTEDINKRFAMG